MKFCAKCGAQNADNAVFCKVCGGPLQAGQQPGQAGQPGKNPIAGGMSGVAAKAKKMDKNKIIGIAAVAVAAILLIVLLSALFSGGGDHGLIGKMMKYTGMTGKPNAEKVVKLYHEDVMKGYTKYRDTTIKKFTNDLQDNLEDVIDGMDDEYDKWKVKVKVVGAENVDKDRLEELDEQYDEAIGKGVKAAKVVFYITYTTIDGEKETPTVSTQTIVKIGARWYLHSSSYLDGAISYAKDKDKD